MVKSPLKSTVNTTNSLLVKISGGKVVSIGRAIRGDHPAALALERFRASLSDHFSVRDTISGTVIRRNVERVPDVAFAGGIEHDVAVERSLIAVSWRGDRRVPDEAIAFVVDAVRSRGLEPVFVTQVKSDDPRHVELAAKFHCEVVSWDDQSHVEQAIRVERTYRACRIILSDRLHGLIFGARSGAIPVAYVHRDSDKLTSTLEDLMPLSIMTESPDTWQSIIKAVEGEPKLKDVQSAVAKAQARVEETGKSIVSLLAGRSSQLEQSR
jgi:hypothetical protein